LGMGVVLWRRSATTLGVCDRCDVVWMTAVQDARNPPSRERPRLTAVSQLCKRVSACCVRAQLPCADGLPAADGNVGPDDGAQPGCGCVAGWLPAVGDASRVGSGPCLRPNRGRAVCW
jgi:hypothetical protein